MKKNLEKKFQLFLHIFTDRLKKKFHPAKKFCTFFHTWKNKQNWQTHFPEQKKQKKKMNFVSQKSCHDKTFFTQFHMFSQTEEKIRELFYPVKNILFMQTSSEFFKNFFSHMKNKFSSEKKGPLKIHSFHPFQTWKKFLNFIFLKPSECFRRTFFFIFETKKNIFFRIFSFFYAWNQVECFRTIFFFMFEIEQKKFFSREFPGIVCFQFFRIFFQSENIFLAG